MTASQHQYPTSPSLGHFQTPLWTVVRRAGSDETAQARVALEELSRAYWHTLCTVTSVMFSPDGTRLVSESHDKTVKVWDAISGQETLTLKGHRDWGASVAFSPDGKRLGSGSVDGTVKVWDATPHSPTAPQARQPSDDLNESAAQHLATRRPFAGHYFFLPCNNSPPLLL